MAVVTILIKLIAEVCKGDQPKIPSLRKFGKITPVRRSRTPPSLVAENFLGFFREFSGIFRNFQGNFP